MSDISEIRLARAYLLTVAEPPAPAVSALIAKCGPIDAAHRVRNGEVPDAVAKETAARSRREITEKDLAHAKEAGTRLIIPEDDEWPRWPLLSLRVADGRGVRGMTGPIALWGRGPARLDEILDRSVTVVGSRAATGYGEHIAAEWAYALARSGVTVLSGAAYGIDGAAHRGALAAGGPSAAVLGCGLGAGYPAGHHTLLRRIAESGVVLSEYPDTTPPARHRFLVRNRLLAALSAGSVVVEADLRSGARNTAGTAAALGKAVMAVPGPITSRTSSGCHEMLRSGTARLVTTADDVLEDVGRLGIDLAVPAAKPSRDTDRLSGDALRVYDALPPRAGRSVDWIAAEAGVPTTKARAVLCALELDGLSQRCDAGWRRGTGRGRRDTG
ncbi:DNA-processing protein DprA [Haloechinothrix salitolerans]|uniref:DNA-processing protein DprA n=1 Tax=Haloechinothrix salitolerans TaxID=926830 RepID=A0ABW2C5L8_9PSEU